MRRRRLGAPAQPIVRPVFWWALGGAVLLFLIVRRRDVKKAAVNAGRAVEDGAREIVATLSDITDKVTIVRRLFVAVSSELPQLPFKSRAMIVAQALSESGWNTGAAARNGNNWFNIIATPAWTGETWVAVNGDRSYTPSTCKKLDRPMSKKDAKGRAYCLIDQTWRKYPTINDAVRDYWRVLSQSRYNAARAALEAGDIDNFAAKLREGGYYDAPLEEYRANLNSLVASVTKRLP